jgi:uncharacterized protein (DUF58 family)
MTTQSKLLDTEFLKKVERLTDVNRRPFAGRLKAEKRPIGYGQNLDRPSASGYRDEENDAHSHGSTHCQLEELFTRLFTAPEDITIHLLLDALQSMECRLSGESGSATKFDFARKLAAAMGYVGLIRYGQVRVMGFSLSAGRRVPALRGRGATSDLFSYLESLRAGGRKDFVRSLQNFAARTPAPSVCIILSDFYHADWEKGVRALLAHRHHVVLLQILTVDEIEPTSGGDLRLVNAETGIGRDISLTPAVLAHYQDAIQRFCRALAERAERTGMDYVHATTDAPFEDMLLNTLRGTEPSGG